MDYQLRQDVEKKLKGEIGTIYKTRSASTAVVLTYPNSYYVGMSNLGFQAIYRFLNERNDVCCERAFFPDNNLIGRYRKTGTSLFSLESQTPLAEFDIIAFSVSFENDYLNILHILELAQVPVKAEERDEHDPLIILGGAVTAINPEPLAMFIDLFVIGDGEPILGEVIETYQRLIANSSKQQLLESLAAIPGVYVPSLYDITYDQEGYVTQIRPRANAPKSIGKCPVDNLDQYPAYSRIFTEDTEFGNMFLLQINRGCCYKCRFCHTGYTQSPLRHLSLEVALGLIQHGLQYRDRIGLVGAAIADYPYLQEICTAISSQGGKVSVSSLRLGAFSGAESLLETLVHAGQKTLTMAPETGSERLRKLIRKPLSNQVFYDSVEYIMEAQIPNLKLYFLIGLPTETEDDLEAIITVCTTCRQLMVKAAKHRGTIGKLTVSVNPFVPKPFTPLQWCAMDSEIGLKRKLQHLKRALRRLGNVEVIHEAPKWAIWQGILARGDRRLGLILLLALEYQGNWKKAFRELCLSPEFFVHRTRHEEELFPWYHLHVGVSQQRLRDEYQRLFTIEAQ